jgi:succinoglycan biosynthesis protein ExoA
VAAGGSTAERESFESRRSSDRKQATVARAMTESRPNPRDFLSASRFRGAPVRKISVVIPMRNEEQRISGVLKDVAAQDFSGELEVFVADGGSTDASLEHAHAAAAQSGLALRVVDNPDQLVPFGLNACIRTARGDLIIRLDCKAHYPQHYFRRLAEAAEQSGASNVGGVLVPEGQTAVECAVATAMDSPFGGISWTRHDNARTPVEVDTVYCGAFRREAFSRVGDFDTSLAENHDEDFNLRLRTAGGCIVLDPGIRLRYRPPSSFGALFARYFAYGRWKVPLMLKHRRVLSARSLAPLLFVGSLALLAVGGVWFGSLRWLLAAEAFIYLVAAVVFGVSSIRRRREPSRRLPFVVAAFGTFHFAYGVGMLWGIARAVFPAQKTIRKSAPVPS